MKYSEKNEFIKERWLPLLNFEGDPGVPLLNFKGVPGREVLGPGFLVPRLHFAVYDCLFVAKFNDWLLFTLIWIHSKTGCLMFNNNIALF